MRFRNDRLEKVLSELVVLGGIALIALAAGIVLLTVDFISSL